MRVLILLSVCLLGCTRTVQVSASSPGFGKPAAPVAMSAELSAQEADLTLVFEEAASQVSVAVNGLDGLTVVSDVRPVTDASFAVGASHRLHVAFVPGAGRSQLAVNVTGTFGGATRSKVAIFSIGEGSLPVSPGSVSTTDDGTTVKVLPVAPAH